MPSPLLVLVKPLDGHEGKHTEAALLSPVSVTMEDLDEKTALLDEDEDTIMDFDDDEAMYSSDVPDTDFNDMSTTTDSRMMSDAESIIEEEGPYYFWMIPPEIRTMIYEYLLLSDSAFRLGHHGPYSHEQRRQLYPQILRTCSTIFEEASSVLYGNNTFYLGTYLPCKPL
jgi:hypothetical protein